MIDEKKMISMAKELIGHEDINMDTELSTVDGWDSLVHVMLIAAMADTFGVNVPVEEVSNIVCLKDFKKYE